MRIWIILKRLGILIGIIAGLITIINFLFPWPFRSLMYFKTLQLVSMHSGETFKIEAIKTKDGTTINPPDHFSYIFDIPLEIRGSTKLDRSSHVWVVLKDQYSGYYLQSSAVEIKEDGQWVSYNIRPFAEIKQMIWVLVDDTGNDLFNRKVKAGEWGRFTDLPQNTQQLVYVMMR